jgi:hypothetical protein
LNHYYVRVIVCDRDTEKMVAEDRIFDLFFDHGDWYPAWQKEFGHRWKLQEVISVDVAQPDVALA